VDPAFGSSQDTRAVRIGVLSGTRSRLQLLEIGIARLGTGTPSSPQKSRESRNDVLIAG
jgi:hypothetical protein